MLLYDFPDAYDLFYDASFQTSTRDFYSRFMLKKNIHDVLDCTCGSGQMTMPLAKLGFNVTASDVNRNMMRKARLNFVQNDLMANFVTSDILELETRVKRTFDCVMSTGNSLAHVKNDQLESAIRQMDSVLKPGGTLYIDSRNWDLILERQQRFYLFNPLIRDRGRVNFVQVWDYNPDGSMVFNFLLFEEIENKIVSKRQFYTLYYPFKSEDLRLILEAMGYHSIKFFKLGDPGSNDLSQIDWYAVTAEKPFPSEITDKKTDNKKDRKAKGGKQ